MFTPERRGHGRTADVEGPITFDLMAQDTIAFLETVVGEPAHLVGCSDGAIVGCWLPCAVPTSFASWRFIAGVFHYEGWAPGVLDATANPPEFLERFYAEISPDGPGHYSVIVKKLAKMHATEPALTPPELNRVEARTLVMVGDDDEVGSSRRIRRRIATSPTGSSRSSRAPRTGCWSRSQPSATACKALDFLTSDPVPTLAPIRRAEPNTRL